MRVLIVDDNPLDIELISRMLLKHVGAAIDSVHTAEEGLRRLQLEDYDVVLLDYCLPGQNGLEFLRELHRLANATPVLFMTARGDARVQESAFDAGAADYISKDDSLTSALYRAVEAAAERGRAARVTRERDVAEERRHDAERVIAELETRIEQLEGSLGDIPLTTRRAHIESLTQVEQSSAMVELVRRYGQIIKLWAGDEQQNYRARQMIVDITADFLTLGISSAMLLRVHVEALHVLREQRWQLTSTAPQCSPKLLLLETGLSLLDAYRHSALSAR